MNGSLARYRNGNVETFSFDHTTNLRVRQVIANVDGSVLGTTAGGLIGWKDGNLQTMTVRNGLPCDNIFSIVSDQNSYWLYTGCGLLEITSTQIQQWWGHASLVLKVNVIDPSDGVRPGEAPFSPQASRSPDGKLWFANNSVLQMFDPAHTKKNLVSPPVHVEQIVADGKTYPSDGGMALPPLVRSLEIDYTALSFVAPQKVRFRYKLEGHDVDWQDCGVRRQAFYTDLPPRRYQFRVIAANNDGIWNEQGAALDFSIAPAYYQTNWFRALCLAAFLMLLWAAYQMRVRQLRQKFATLFDARVNERTRIARELHDTLLQSFHGLLMSFQRAANLLPERSVEAKQRLEDAIDQAARAVAEGREAVQGLRSSTVVTNDLAVAIRTLGEELATKGTSENAPAFDVAVAGAQRDLNPILRDDVYRIAGEAVRNAFQHAQARRIEVEIRYDERQLGVRIRDDGKGLDEHVLRDKGRSGHWGLPGMRERAKLVGGQMEIWTELDSGTEIELRIPASIAYGTSAKGQSRERTA
jgi:signal transduction histidine kinase